MKRPTRLTFGHGEDGEGESCACRRDSETGARIECRRHELEREAGKPRLSEYQRDAGAVAALFSDGWKVELDGMKLCERLADEEFLRAVGIEP